jgi:RHS repeat-associated protein
LSKLGSGTFRNSYTSSNRTLTAGNKNYLARQMQLESGLREYYQTLQQPPGNPLGKSVSAQPEQTSAPLPTVVGNYDIPKGWPRTPVQSPSGGPPGAPVQLGSVQSNDSVRAGYGYVDDGKVENDRYFYHPDHLGSTTVITQKDGIGVEYLSYMPFGETLVEEHSTDVELPYKFSGKEQDQETGLLYFGARYYDPKLKFWLGVDPLAEMYPDVSSYVYCVNNPVRFVDPDGREILNGMSKKDSYDIPIRKAINITRNNEDPRVIHLYAHGSTEGMKVVVTGKNQEERNIHINTPQELKKFLDVNSKEWKSRKGNSDITLVLHSCDTGSETVSDQKSWAQKVSESQDMQNVTIFAPTNPLGVNTQNGKNERVENNPDGSKGHWIELKNGKKISVKPAEFKPGIKK